MAIEVQCPNGHRLSCSDDRAGTQGKCPKCGSMFQVPEANGQPASDASGKKTATGSGKDISEPAGTGDSSKKQGFTSESSIAFLCPNGHKLNGPASLQGKPGQCPNCGAKFRIPIYDEALAAAEQARAAAESGGVGGDAEESGDLELEDVEDFEDIEEIGEQDLFIGPPPEAEGGFLPDETFDDEDVHPLARLFMTLWQEREHGGIVEVHLGEGVTILPDWWAQRLSLEAHAVFALQTADGSYVMETVPWEAIKRITVRRIAELPDGVFE